LLVNINLFANLDEETDDFFNKDYDDSLSKQIHEYQMQQFLKKQFFSLDDDIFKDYLPSDININDSFSEPVKKTVVNTIYLQGVAIFAIYVLSEMPKSVSRWETSPFEDPNLGESWLEHVKAGPIWDQDDLWINWIGHPVSGAWYYTLARGNGLDPFESFLYSTFLSTFVWEYGYESFAEIPSLQDLILTPVIGSVLGEYMYYLEMKIDKNYGEVWGSRTLGSISYFFINPFGNMAQGVENLLGISTTVRYQTYQVYNDTSQANYNLMLNKPKQFSQNGYGLYINFEY